MLSSGKRGAMSFFSLMMTHSLIKTVLNKNVLLLRLIPAYSRHCDELSVHIAGH